MDRQVPDWLSKDFLTECLQKEEDKRNIVVTTFSASPAAPPGSNYTSSVTRVRVEYKNNVNDNDIHFLSLVIKSDLIEGSLKGLFDEPDLTEQIFYKQFLPVASKLTNIPFIPKCFFSPTFRTIVLEDLKEQEFIMADRMKLLDFEHCCLYFAAAASLHAVSIAVNKEFPELVESISKEKLFSNNLKCAKVFQNMAKFGFECFTDRLDRFDYLKKYRTVIRDISRTIWDLVIEAHKPVEGLNTVTHGDSWTSNLMFKYDDNGDVSQIKLLDFQALRYASPITDLVNFIWTSANHDVRKNRLQELFLLYVDTFNNKLRALNCTESLTYDNVIYNIQKLSPVALFISVLFVPAMCHPVPVDFGLFVNRENDTKKSENPYEIYYNDNYCKNYLPKLLEEFELTGVFEHLEKYTH